MHKKKLVNRFVAAFAVVCFFLALPVSAAVTVTKSQDLSFGAFVPTSGSGTVTIPAEAAGVRTGSGVVLFMQGAGATGQSAVFSVSGGVAGNSCVITLSAASLAGPGASMAASLTSSPSGAIVLDGSGGGTIYVGGTLAVGAAQTAGSYSDTITVTVNSCQ